MENILTSGDHLTVYIYRTNEGGNILTKGLSVPIDVEDVDKYIEEKEPGWKLSGAMSISTRSVGGNITSTGWDVCGADDVREFLKSGVAKSLE